MKKHWVFAGWLIGLLGLLLFIAACAPKLDTAGQKVGDPTGRIFHPELSCVGYCSGYSASGNEWCFCDAPCTEKGNCCADFETACPEVAGN